MVARCASTVSTQNHTTQDDRPEHGAVDPGIEEHPALVVAWSTSDPSRVGEVSIFPEGSERIIGRGEAEGDELERARFFRQRPGVWQVTPALAGQALSRRQLRVRSHGAELEIESVGRAQLKINGRVSERGRVAPGDVVTLGSQLVLFCALRPSRMPALRSFPAGDVRQFGEPDAHGLVGESPAAWHLRETTALLARAPGHVLVLGESGTGKEHVARMLHLLSSRGSRPMVSRSAATLPSSLIDAELFGNIKNYPNVGMPERPGLIGEAHRSTLFLDEIGELGDELQSHLLRVLDAGEYQRLGSASVQQSDVRLVCATNRAAEVLKHDLLARLTLRLPVPGLDARREDIPLIARSLMQRAVREAPEVANRFFTDGLPRIEVALIERLLVHRYSHHVRELEGLLWQSMAESRSDTLELTPALGERLGRPQAPAAEIGADDVRRALERHGGNQSRAFRDLGLKNRYALIRLMKRHGIGGAETE
jgi:two-component system nitrogen regulation response regulator GlnG/two-component system response regulator HydG